MTKVIVDEILRAKLPSLDKQVELCDPSGRTLGHFLPARLYERLVSDWVCLQTNEAEVRRHLDEPGGSTLAEIMERLQSR